MIFFAWAHTLVRSQVRAARHACSVGRDGSVGCRGRARVLCADGYKAVRSRDAVQGDPRKRPRALVLVDPPYQARPASPELAAELAP